MFNTFFKNLLDPSPEPLKPEDARLALAALLVRVARSDHDYAQSEKDNILRVLATRFNLSREETEELCKTAEAVEKDAPDTVRFTRAIKESVAHEDRVQVIEALWQVALADGERDVEEDALLRLVANLLGISDVESANARKRIESA